MPRLPVVALLCTLAAGGCLVEVTPAEAAAKPNVIVILVDAQRADVLGPYGYKTRKTTPNLDKFAAAGVVWENTISQNAWTVPSVASLFTGVDPQAHRTLRFQVTDRVEMDTMSELHDTLAESFKAGGYTTGAFIKSTVIDSSRGFSQGFDKFEIVGGTDQAWGQSARQLNDAALPWLSTQAKSGKPFMAYLHYMDPHSPYKAPEPWYSKYKGSYAGKFTGAHVEIEDAVKKGTGPGKDDWNYLRALYDAEVEYWDTEFGRLLAELDAAGATKNTIVAVVADHGEAFYEHDNIFHGHLYQENIHVPVVIRGPGLKPGRLGGYTQVIDVAPTLADLCGVPKGAAWMGQSFAAGMAGGKGHADFVYSEYVNMRTVIDPAGLKLIVGDGADKLFDLKADPRETNNLASTRPADVARLRVLADARTAQGKTLGAKYPLEKPKALTDEQTELLRQLGYIE